MVPFDRDQGSTRIDCDHTQLLEAVLRSNAGNMDYETGEQRPSGASAGPLTL